MLESWEAFISSIRKMVNIKKPTKTEGQSWRFQRSRLQNRNKAFRGSANWSDEWWSQQDSKNKACVHRGSSRIHEKAFGIISTEKIMKITSQAKDTIRWVILIWYANLFWRLKRWKSRMRKPQWTVDKEWKKLETIPAWQLDSQRDVSPEAHRDKKSALCYFYLKKRRNRVRGDDSQNKVGIPRHASLRPSTPWDSLQERAAIVESRRRGTSTRLEDQCIDLGILYVDNDECRCSSWTKIQWNNGKYSGTQTSKSSLICSVSLRDWHRNIKPKFWMNLRLIAPSWTRSSLSNDQVITWTKSKILRFRLKPGWKSIQKRTEDGQINSKNFNSPILTELFGIDAEPIEFEWNIFQDLRHWKSSRRSMNMWKDESPPCGCSMTSCGRRNSEKCISNSHQVKNYAKRFSRGHWSFLGPGDEQKWYGTSQLQMWRTMGFHRRRDGGTMQRNWAPSVQGHSVLWVAKF